LLEPLLPQFDVLELLGQGGMGAVYRARQRKLDREVALKILPAELGQDATFSERFAREAKAIARLNHPGVVGIHDYGEAGPYHYLVLELVEGANLRELAAGEPIGVAEALRLLRELCAAVDYAHRQDVIHRDLKPENVLVDGEGRVRVVDFGLAKVADAARHSLLPSLTGTRVAVGTPHYMAPEQLEGIGVIDAQADVYSLGVLAYELLTGRLPLGRFPAPSEEVPGLDPAIDAVVMEALDRDPARRPQGVAALLERLEGAKAEAPARPRRRRDSGATARPASSAVPRSHEATARRLLWALFGVGVVVLLSSGLEWATLRGLMSDDPLFAQLMRNESITITAWNGTQSLFGVTLPTWLIPLFGVGLIMTTAARLGGWVRTNAWVLGAIAGLGFLQAAHFFLVVASAEHSDVGVGSVLALLCLAVALPAGFCVLCIDHGWGAWKPKREVVPASRAFSRALGRLQTRRRAWSADQVRTEARGRAIMNRGRRRPKANPDAGGDLAQDG
jgi:tRNA A-37 threonylcarbamoyl transferase component Bud32